MLSGTKGNGKNSDTLYAFNVSTRLYNNFSSKNIKYQNVARERIEHIDFRVKKNMID